MVYCTRCGKELSEEERFCANCGAQNPGSSPTISPQTTSEVTTRASQEANLATWGERFVAWIIDTIIFGVISGLFSLPGLPIIPFVTFGMGDVIKFLYWMLMEGTTGQSIGKMAMGIKVIRTDGLPATLMDSAIQSFGKAFLLPIDCIIGWIVESCKEKRQRLFSMLSNTVVVKAQRK